MDHFEAKSIGHVESWLVGEGYDPAEVRGYLEIADDSVLDIPPNDIIEDINEYLTK